MIIITTKTEHALNFFNSGQWKREMKRRDTCMNILNINALPMRALNNAADIYQKVVDEVICEFEIETENDIILDSYEREIECEGCCDVKSLDEKYLLTF